MHTYWQIKRYILTDKKHIYRLIQTYRLTHRNILLTLLKRKPCCIELTWILVSNSHCCCYRTHISNSHMTLETPLPWFESANLTALNRSLSHLRFVVPAFRLLIAKGSRVAATPKTPLRDPPLRLPQGFYEAVVNYSDKLTLINMVKFTYFI